MDIAAIRADLAAACGGFDFNVSDNVMEAPPLPAVLIGLPSRLEYQSMRDVNIFIPVHVWFSTADSVDAQTRLSEALTNRSGTESLLDSIRTATSDHWKALRIVDVSGFGLAADVDQALVCEINLEIVSR